MCGHVLNYTLIEGYTRLNMGIRKPKSSAPIGAWPPAPPRSQPVQLFSTAACWLQTFCYLHSMNE
eukprot:1366392-Pleurochrysis_carterae.AAC.1